MGDNKRQFFLPVFGLVGLAGIVGTLVHRQREKQRFIEKTFAEYEQKRIAANEQAEALAEKRRLDAEAQAERRRLEAKAQVERRRLEAKAQVEKIRVEIELKRIADLEQQKKAAEEYVAQQEQALFQKRQKALADAEAKRRKIAEENEAKIHAIRQARGTYILLQDLKDINIPYSDDCSRIEDFQIFIETPEEREKRFAPFRNEHGMVVHDSTNPVPEAKMFIAHGGFGSIWLACRAAECKKPIYNYVGKVVYINVNKSSMQDFMNEAIIAKFAGEKGFGVPVVTSFRCDKGQQGVIIMKLMKPLPKQASSDDKLIDTMTLDDFKQVLQKIDDMHEHGIRHNDLYVKNLVRDPRTSQLFIADFGQAKASLDPVPIPDRAAEVVGLILGDSRPQLKLGTVKFQEAALEMYRKILNNNILFLSAVNSVRGLQAWRQAFL